MLRHSLAAATALVVGLTACLDEPTGPQCTTLSNTITETRGDTVVTSSGLRYIETDAGSGTVAATWCNGAQVIYVGTLLDGTEFDSNTIAFTPGLDNIIPGFAYGVVGLKIDGNRRLIIPPGLAYGAAGNGGAIPPNATIVFDIELIAVQ